MAYRTIRTSQILRLLLLSALIAACTTGTQLPVAPPPPPPAPQDAGSADAGAGCREACARCPEWAGEAGSCGDGCLAVSQSAKLDIACFRAAPSCDDARACFR